MKKIIYILLASAMFISVNATSFSFAENIESKLKVNQEEQAQVDKKINELNKKIDSVQKKIDSSNEQMDKLNKESKNLKKEITKLEKDILSNEESLGDRLKVVNNNYTLSYLKVILSSDSISNFLDNIYIVGEIIEQDKKMLKDLESDKIEIEEKQEKLNKNKEEVQVIKDELVKDKDSLDKDKKELRNLKKKLEKEEERLEKEIARIAQEAARKAEEERKAQEAKKQLQENISQATTSNTSNKVISNGSWPVPGYTRVSSPFGYRIHPVLKVKKMHTGIDIPAPQGTSVVSVSSGRVIYSGVKGTYGNVVMVQHDNGLVSLYAHNSSLCVSVGTRVQKGQVIAKIGSTGRSTGPHLHFEIRVNGTAQNPLNYL